MVPYVDPFSDGDDIDYKSGEIEEVYCISSAEPALVTIRTGDNDYIHIDLTSDKQDIVPDEKEQTIEG